MDNRDIGANVKFFRKQAGMTQEQLGHSVGLSTMTIRRYESGERIITKSNLERIAIALNVPVSALTMQIETPKQFYEAVDILHQLTLDMESEASDIEKAGFELIHYCYFQMNLTGQRKAVNIVGDLAKIPEYQRQKPEDTGEAPNTPSEGKDTTQDD